MIAAATPGCGQSPAATAARSLSSLPLSCRSCAPLRPPPSPRPLPRLAPAPPAPRLVTSCSPTRGSTPLWAVMMAMAAPRAHDDISRARCHDGSVLTAGDLRRAFSRPPGRRCRRRPRRLLRSCRQPHCPVGGSGSRWAGARHRCGAPRSRCRHWGVAGRALVSLAAPSVWSSRALLGSAVFALLSGVPLSAPLALPRGLRSAGGLLPLLACLAVRASCGRSLPLSPRLSFLSRLPSSRRVFCSASCPRPPPLPTSGPSGWDVLFAGATRRHGFGPASPGSDARGDGHGHARCDALGSAR